MPLVFRIVDEARAGGRGLCQQSTRNGVSRHVGDIVGTIESLAVRGS